MTRGLKAGGNGFVSGFSLANHLAIFGLTQDPSWQHTSQPRWILGLKVLERLYDIHGLVSPLDPPKLFLVLAEALCPYHYHFMKQLIPGQAGQGQSTVS